MLLLFQHIHLFYVIHYLTLRTILSALTALLLSLLLGGRIIRKLESMQLGQVVRDNGPKSHLTKAGTPTMGGALILIAVAISTLLWGDLSNHYIWVTLLITLGFGAIGWVDDYRKIMKHNTDGLSARCKLIWQSILAVTASLILYYYQHSSSGTELVIPFLTQVTVNLGLWYFILAYFVIVGSSNAVNLTDGLDGLAILPVVMIAAALGLFSYLTGNMIFSHYLIIPYIPGVGELSVFCGALVGAGLGFLWFNSYPAQVFMGDVGSLGLGGALGVVAITIQQEIVFFVMSGVFVLETVSVILQVASFKLLGKRIFKMAPIHHHFELKGWAEPKVIVRFWIITFVLVLIGLATLKLR